MDNLYRIAKNPLTLELMILPYSVMQITGKYLFISTMTDRPDKTIRIEKSQIGLDYFVSSEAAFDYQIGRLENSLSKLKRREKLVKGELEEMLALQSKFEGGKGHDSINP